MPLKRTAVVSQQRVVLGWGSFIMSNYSEKLRHPFWQKKRLKIMERDNFSCCVCGSCTITLNVHHKQYINGLEPWEYEDELLITLCEICHSKEHEEPLIIKTISDTWYDLAIQNLYIMERLRFRFLKYKKLCGNKMFVLLMDEANSVQTLLFNTEKYV